MRYAHTNNASSARSIVPQAIHLCRAVGVPRAREEVLARLSQVLQDLMRKAQRHAITQFQEAATRFARQTEEILDKAAAGQAAVLQSRISEIEQARTRGTESNAAKCREIEALSKELQSAQGRLVQLK